MTMRSSLPAVLMLALAGCARVVIDDGAITCLTWSDEAHATPNALPTEGLACEPRVPGAVNKPIPSVDFTRTDVCTGLPDGAGTCPSPSGVAERLRPCIEHEEGEACGPSFGGGCTRTFMWSLCGPDPLAHGGCCYEALVVTSTWFE